MNWLVCSNRETKEFTIMSRVEREFLLDVWMELEDGVPTHVVKTFEKKKDAKKYVRDMKKTNNLINKI